MKARLIPEVRALYERVRRPAERMVVMAVLLAPLAGFAMLRGKPIPEPLPSRSAVAIERIPAPASGEEESAVARAWRERALDREVMRGAQRMQRVYTDYRVTPDLAERIHRTALATGIDPEVAFGLVRVESSFRRTAVSWAGAVGYTQVLPSTARWIVPGTTRRDLLNTDTNLYVGFTYLRYLADKYEGDMFLALTAYNRGPGTVDRLLRRGVSPDNGYAGRVLSRVDGRGSTARG